MDKTILIAVACVIVIGLVLYLKKPTTIDNYEGNWKPDGGNKTCGNLCGADCLERFGQPLGANGKPIGPTNKDPFYYFGPTEKSLACGNTYCPKVCGEDMAGSRTGYCLATMYIGVKKLTQDKIKKRLQWANQCFLEPRIIL